MEILESKESRLLGRTEVQVLFKDKAGALTRRDAVKEVAQEMKVDESRVGLISLYPEAGTRGLVGRFHVYSSDDSKRLQQNHFKIRMMTKEEREKLKQEKKKAEQSKPK